MGFLDKLKPQPRWKHADPAVRLEAIRDLDDAAELALIAESDPDVRVRRLVLTRLTDPDVIHRLATADPDADLRERAADSLVSLACRTNGHRQAAAAADPAESPDADPALRAVRALTDPKRLSAIARSEAAEDVRAEALARIEDERGLGAIARHARHETTARVALARVTSPEELLDVSLNSDHKDVALEAFDRRVEAGADVDLLRSVESRASHKAVSRRARALIQEIENAEAARLAALEERRRQIQTTLDAVEQVADLAADVAMARAELTRLTEAWQALDVADEAPRERFAALTMAAEAAIVRRQREAEEMAERRRLRAEAVATRDALCARVETLDGDDVLAQLVPIEEEWRSLLPLVGNGPEADRLAERFARAVAACRTRHEMGARLADERARLEALVAEAEGLAPAEDAARTRWPVLSREARGIAAVLTEAGRPAADLLERIEAVDARFAAEAASREAAAEHARAERLALLQRLSTRARRTAEADTITLREGERLMRDLRSGLEGIGAASAEIDALVAELRALQQQIAPRVRELREMDEWRRFANGQRQEQLIAMAEAIVASLKSDDEAGKPSDLAATAKALRELHSQWQEVAEAPRAVAQRHWDRFRTATDAIRARCEVYFAKVREERSAALARKSAIVAEAEALAASSDWAKAPARLQELQTEWQALGPVGRETGRELSQRFRTACNAFFARRREDLTERKRVWAENLAKKEALCARVEALAASTDWEAAAAEVKRTQAEWKTIGPVRKNKSEAIWIRFRAAADAFFERYHHRHEITVTTKLAEREALVVEIEQLASEAGSEPPADLSERVQQLRQTWNRSVPIPAAGMKPLADRWQAALAALVAAHPAAFAGTDLDPATVVSRMQKLVARIESHLTELPAEPERGASQTELLAARLRSALATNAMGGRTTAETRWRAAADAVKDAQAAWQRLPPVHTPEAEALASRFREACRRIQDRARRQGPASPRRHDEPAAMAR